MKGAITDPHTHKREATVPINTSQPFFIPLRAFALCALSLFSCLSCFCLVAVAMFALSRLHTSVFLRSLSFCLSFVYRHQQKTNQPTGLQCGHQSELVLLEEVILCISYVGTIVVSKICHGHTNTHTHAPLSGRTETGASRISQ